MLGLKPERTAGKKLRQTKHDQTADTADHTKYSAVNDAFKCFWYWVEVVEEQSYNIEGRRCVAEFVGGWVDENAWVGERMNAWAGG